MKIKQVIAIFSLLILPSLCFAADYYVDCSSASNGNGSYASPWNKISSVNNFSFNTGDDVYFKANTTCTLNSDSDRLQVDWSGTSSNRVIIGAYYGNGLFGLGGNDRPIISGNNNKYPGAEQGAIDVRNRSYVTVSDLKVQYAGRAGETGKAIDVRDSKNINIENCHLWRSRGAILYAKVNTGEVLDNIAHEIGHPDYAGTGAAIEITAANSAGATTNILVSRNKVFNSKHEGIGLYKKVTNSIIEYNVVRDIRSYFIYIDAGMYNTIRYNLIYESEDNILSTSKRSSNAISVNHESFHNYFFSGYNDVYGNFIGGTRAGITFGCGIVSKFPDAVCHPGEKIYNNTIVDTDTTFVVWQSISKNNIDIKNNISWIETEGIGSRHVHNNAYNVAGVTWSHNLFHGGPTVSGNAANNMITGNPMLTKGFGWRSLGPDSLAGNEFFPESGSPAINAGILIKNYSSLITDADFTASPIRVATNDNLSDLFPVGAWMGWLNDPFSPIIPPQSMTVGELK